LPAGPIDVAVLAAGPLVIFPRLLAPALYDLILGVFAKQGQTPAIAQEAVQMQTLIGLVAGGLGFALVPSSMRYLKRPGVVYRNLKGAAIEVEVGLSWRRDNDSAVLSAWLDSLDCPTRISSA
jgi:DNA-binding transcriptional LysR family regulator